MTNRVTELESTVAHLQAAVDGLRAELVDANERIRALEQEQRATGASTAADEQESVPFALLDSSNGTTNNGSDAPTDTEPPKDERDHVDDIIVA